jgi:hypothetical protein
MKNRSSRWGWLTLSLGALLAIVTWSLDAYALLCWAWVICSLSACWIALTRLRLGLTQWLIVGAAMLNAAAGVANGLVMTANGMRMPVEPVYDWDRAPSFLGSPADRRGAFCRMVVTTDDAVAPVTDMSVHYDVPVPHLVRGRIPVLTETPRFAFLDDRHGVRICGEDAIYSKGDMMGFIGSVFLGIPGLILLIIGWIWRKIFRRTRGPVP